MKTKNMYLNRLLKLANTLALMEKQKTSNWYKAKDDGSSLEQFTWAMNQVPEQQTRDPINLSLARIRRHEKLFRAAVYFSLTADEALHLFAAGYQEEFLGGCVLDAFTSPGELAGHIREFVRIKDSLRNGEHPDERVRGKERKTKIITLKTKQYGEKRYAS